VPQMAAPNGTAPKLGTGRPGTASKERRCQPRDSSAARLLPEPIRQFIRIGHSVKTLVGRSSTRVAQQRVHRRPGYAERLRGVGSGVPGGEEVGLIEFGDEF